MQQTNTKKFKTRLDWVGMMIHYEFRKSLKFEHITKCYMCKPEALLVNEAHEVRRDFNIWIDILILDRNPELEVHTAK